jgi:hypothetical protein
MSDEVVSEAQEVKELPLDLIIGQLPLFQGPKALRFSASEGPKRIGVTLFGRHGAVGISLKEVDKSRLFSVQVSPNHRYGNSFPLFPYFIPHNRTDVVNLICEVAIAIYKADTAKSK